MWLFKNIKNWNRIDSDLLLNDKQEMRRKKAESDTADDLKKPIQQFLTDVHEEANRPPCDKSDNPQLTYADDRILDALDKISCENKRLVALQTITAFESAKTACWLLILTILLFIATLILVLIECGLLRKK